MMNVENLKVLSPKVIRDEGKIDMRNEICLESALHYIYSTVVIDPIAANKRGDVIQEMNALCDLLGHPGLARED